MAICEPWIDDWDDVVVCCPEASSVTDEDLQNQFIDYASEVLSRLSGNRFGLCEITRRPCVECHCYCSPCLCGPVERVDLGYSPVAEVTEVMIDGVVLDPSAYRVDDWRWLTRIDGLHWPRCQTLNSADDEVGAFTVTWTYGTPVPTGGIFSAQKLVCELVKSCNNDASCQLPSRATNIQREGVTIGVILPPKIELINLGMTGVDEIDLWLTSLRSARPRSMFTDPLAQIPIATNTGV